MQVQAQPLNRTRLDSLIKELNGAHYQEADTAKVILLDEIARAYLQIDPDKGIAYGLQELKLAEKIHFEQGIGLANRSIGANYMIKATYPTALEYYMKALSIFERMHDMNQKSATLVNIGNLFRRLKQKDKSLQYLREGNKLAEQIGNDEVQAGALFALAALCHENKDTALGMQYALRAQAKYKVLGDPDGQAKVLLTIANLYNVKQQFSKALSCYEEALQHKAELSTTVVLSSIYGSMGELFLHLSRGQSVGARNDPLYKAGKNANLHRAIGYLNTAIEYCRVQKDAESIMEYSLYLVNVYSALGEYKNELENLNEYYSIRDSLFSVDNKLKIAALETQREAELKEKQIIINHIQEKQNWSERLFFIAGIGLLVALIAVILRNYNRQRENNAALAKSNSSLAEEKAKSDQLAVSLQESIVHKDELTTQLELAATMKSKFLANMSHELRTPVTLFTGMLELMKDQRERYTVGDKQRLEVAYTNSRKLQYMVEEILDLSKLESREPGRIENGALPARMETRQVAPLLKRMVYSFETYIEKEKLSLEYDDKEAEELYLAIDEALFEKIINNLVYNAIKFNKPGGRIKTTLAPSADGTMAELTISDTGSGIQAEDLPHIFDRFYQGSGHAASATAQGMGIGLSLVKEFTLLHGGTVGVSSRPGKGTAFKLKFPLVEKGLGEQQAEAPPEQPAENWGYFAKKQSVLIVEDNAEMKYYLREILGSYADLAEAGNGKEALAWLGENTPDLIISDIMMPEMDGREFIDRLKNTEAWRKIPVITLSALADKESQLGMLRMGIDDYIVKPFNALELRIRVYNLLYNQAERQRFNRQPAEPEDIAADSREADEFRAKITAYVLGKIKNTNITIVDMAADFYVGDRQLQRLAKSLTGCTPAQLVKEVRLQKAYELLLSGDIYKIDDVARQVGYDTPAYFSKQFFERFGKRPTDLL